MKRISITLSIVLAAALFLLEQSNGEESPQLVDIQVLAAYPHDRTAFTQGLLYHDGYLYESTGLYGSSELRKVDPETGRVLRRHRLPEQYFGEGLALAGDRLVQLTWQEETAFVYDLHSFDLVDRFTYRGEGWGLCFDGEHFYRSDGTDKLYMHHRDTFELVETRFVTLAGQPVRFLNELACAGPWLYANVFMTSHIYRICKERLRVSAIMDGGNLLSLEERRSLPADAVFNGIAWNQSDDLFYVTGKRWPVLFKVRLDHAEGIPRNDSFHGDDGR